MSPPRYRRTDRVAALILREVTRIVHEEVRDPRVGFVTFTGADVSPDLTSGRVFVSVMGSEAEKRESIEGLQSAAPFIRGQLWDLLDLKTIPVLVFELDRSLERAARIDELLERIQSEERAREQAVPEAGETSRSGAVGGAVREAASGGDEASAGDASPGAEEESDGDAASAESGEPPERS